MFETWNYAQKSRRLGILTSFKQARTNGNDFIGWKGEFRRMIAFDEKNSRLCYAYDGESLTVEPWGENSFRVRATKQGAFPETDWALLPPQPCPVTAEIAPEGARMTNGKLTAELSSSGCLKFWKDGNHCVLEEFWRTRKDKNFPYGTRCR